MKKKAAKRVVLSILAVLLALILILGAAATVWAGNLLNKINRADDTVQTLSQEEIQSILQETDGADGEVSDVVMNPEDVTMPEEAADLIEENENIINILLIGQDRRENQTRQRSDSMVLCTVNLEKKTLVMTSLMRDMYLQIPDWNGETYEDNRINICYAIGGMEMLNKCIEMNLGVVVDYNIEVDFSGFEEIVDILGGLDLELTREEAREVGGGARSGINHLNGEQTLNYSRLRHIDTEYARTERQRTVLMAIFEKIRGMNLLELDSLASSFLPLITTDMSNDDIAQCILKIFPVLTQLQVTTQRIPADDTCHSVMIRDMCVLVMDLEANRQILKETLK